MLKLKGLTLPSGIIQSPMAGCTDLAFRLVARSHGMEFAFLEMNSADALVRKNARTLDMLKRVEEDRPLGAQIVGCDPEIMGKAAAIIEDMGFDLVDLNLGCPVPKVTAPGGGSALLKEPETAKKIFENVVKKIKKIPVTVKMRKGYEDPTGEEAVKISKMAEDAGLDAVTIHGRTRAQGYAGQADWQAIGRVKKELRIPVIGNGDIVDSESAKKMLEQSGADGIMIGRGGLGNPWIYQSIHSSLTQNAAAAQPSLEDIKKTALKHLELEIQFEGERVGILRCRRILCWYFKNVPGIAHFREAVNHAESAEEMRRLVENFPSHGN